MHLQQLRLEVGSLNDQISNVLVPTEMQITKRLQYYEDNLAEKEKAIAELQLLRQNDIKQLLARGSLLPP